MTLTTLTFLYLQRKGICKILTDVLYTVWVKQVFLIYFFNIPTHAHNIYTLKNTKIHIKNTLKLGPTCFILIFKTIFRGLVDSVHELPEDGLKNGDETCRAKF